MKLECLSFDDNQPIPPKFAFAVQDREAHTAPGKNHNPHLRWSDVPAGTHSFALICHDPDVPTRFDDANQEGRTISASLPRRDFFHWVLADLPASASEIREGEVSRDTSPKRDGKSVLGARAGLNDYSSEEEPHFDYDGPCPPWNDEIPHHYVFTLYALDVPQLSLGERFGGQELREAIAGHVLGQASVTGLYSLNPNVRF